MRATMFIQVRGFDKFATGADGPSRSGPEQNAAKTAWGDIPSPSDELILVDVVLQNNVGGGSNSM